ncbi:Calcium-transporting P-type ATPase, N-terminal autoinhibitory domain-containing protein [Cynara cardunculus var. scolymus]|uniref:P-type Ca(2+) transporter n=1 Tax=Cynara cardunculus var. scolymus TaxID=59895 RepID=A0A103YB44_CYNCS|nr:Calcium-transporting P-type ATPase, N-terminal autoinhibitory domain-containing protein [Cynara cardunculus var. scolymus]
MTTSGTSPSSSRPPPDIESGVVPITDPDDDFDDPFDITTTKNASTDSLRRWRQAALVLNASRRFRYTLDLRKNEDQEKRRRMIRSHAQVIRAALLFKLAGERAIGICSLNFPYDIIPRSEVKGLSEMLKTDLDRGVPGDDCELSDRRNAFGSNTYPVKEGRSFLVCYIFNATNFLICSCSYVMAMLSAEGLEEGWYDGGSITFAVLLVIFVTVILRLAVFYLRWGILNHRAFKQITRGGRREKVSIYDVVVGDVIPLKIGDQVPADGLLIKGHSLAIDESSMTGESKIVHKDQKAPFLMSGCKVADGTGTMLVTSVGINTEWGLLMASISEDTGEETPLQVRLNGVATFIGIVGLAVALLVLAVLMARFFTGNSKNRDGTVQFVRGQTSVSEAVDGVIKIFTAAVTIVVVAVPEGLPLAVTLTLAYSMKKMMADKALMTVVEAYVGQKKIDPPEDGLQYHSTVASLLNEGIAQNTSGSVFSSKDGACIEVSGSPTEKALLQWGVKVIYTICIFSIHFHADSQVHIHWKGAAEIVLASCKEYLDTNGSLQPTDKDMEYLKKAIEEMAARSLRCVAIAYRNFEIDEIPVEEEQLAEWNLPEDDLILLAIVGIKDPCRPGVKNAVKICTDAGVKVRMVTGDNIQTAKAIAIECGILSSGEDATEPNIIEGKTFREYSEKEREHTSKQISVMGRSSPSDKLLLVQTLRKLGEVVAVTGDGTNDAPALHEADIGLAMGIQGTEVAKESSDIIILDDNFASVVKVVRWGRSVYANIQKFIQFQLTVNVAALVINVVAAVSSGDVPLNTVQLLWVNLIMDTLGALALATEPPTDHLMHRSPVGRREPLVTNIMWRNLIIQALYQVAVLLVLNFRGTAILNLKNDERGNAVKNTLIFNGFVLCQIFNEFNARKPDQMNVFSGVTKNYLFMGIVGTTLILQVRHVTISSLFNSLGSSHQQLDLIGVYGLSQLLLAFSGWFFDVHYSIRSANQSWPLAIVGKLIPVPQTPLARVFSKPYQRCIASRHR